MEWMELNRYLPEGGLSFIDQWLPKQHVQLKLTRSRASKLGDYRYDKASKMHKISINHNLEPQLFFFVLTHEIAHLLVRHHTEGALPHGKEWKSTYRRLLLESLEVYTPDFKPLVLDFARSPKAGFMAFPPIVRYFSNPEEGSFVEDLQEGSVFAFRNHVYKLIGRNKKRYLCLNLKNGKKYLFNRTAQVQVLEDAKTR